MKKSDDTRENILKAAEKLFLEKGYAGTSILAIAKEAGVSKALVLHHFKKKDQLWTEVKHAILDRLEFQAIDYKSLSCKDYFYQLIQQRLELYQNHPEISRLMAWQRLETANIEYNAPNPASPLKWIEAIKFFQGQGGLKQVSPELVAVFLSSALSPLTYHQSSLLEKNAELKKEFVDIVFEIFCDKFVKAQ